jgi:hypothetical protein
VPQRGDPLVFNPDVSQWQNASKKGPDGKPIGLSIGTDGQPQVGMKPVLGSTVRRSSDGQIATITAASTYGSGAASEAEPALVCTVVFNSGLANEQIGTFFLGALGTNGNTFAILITATAADGSIAGAAGFGTLTSGAIYGTTFAFTQTGSIGAGGITATAALNATAVQTSGTYSAAPNDLVLVDISGGSAFVQVNLPSAPPSGTRIGVKIIGSPQPALGFGNGIYPTSSECDIKAQGSDNFIYTDPNGLFQTNFIRMYVTQEAAVWQYDAGLNLWVAESNDPGTGYWAEAVGSGQWAGIALGSLMAGSLSGSDAQPFNIQAGGGFTQILGSLSTTVGDEQPLVYMFSKLEQAVNAPGVPWTQISDIFSPIPPNGDGSFFVKQSSTYWTYANSWTSGSGTDEPFRWRRSASPPLAVEFSGVLVPGTLTDGTAILTLSGPQWSAWQSAGWSVLPYKQQIAVKCIDGSTVTKSTYIEIDTASPPTVKCYGLPGGCTKISVKGLVYLK